MQGQLLRFAAWGGVIISLGFAVGGFIESVNGFSAILRARTDSPVVLFAPYFIAGIAFVFNALSPLIFKMLIQRSYTTMSHLIILFLWACFVAFDVTTNWCGLLTEYTGVVVTNWATMHGAISHLDALGIVLIVLFTAVLSFAPLLACTFYEVAKMPEEVMEENLSHGVGVAPPAPRR